MPGRPHACLPGLARDVATAGDVWTAIRFATLPPGWRSGNLGETTEELRRRSLVAASRARRRERRYAVELPAAHVRAAAGTTPASRINHPSST
ncbi:hypothetical protein [Burkholderia pyrrocinia]|uniref:hypothetical protein n=1 Tax=Burkholderia pyrrocinia TaxID=60550 RepID=UPI0020C5B731|nr:hypothetical protein [Burkholderia pyrrocinia]